MMMIPKTIRLNANLIALFKFSNKNTILDDIYPTMSAFITKEQFKNLYDYATEKPHDSLVIDTTQGRPTFQKNFESVLHKQLFHPLHLMKMMMNRLIYILSSFLIWFHFFFWFFNFYFFFLWCILIIFLN
jgi:hypothetical protein